jgi:MarR family 2-MHQ and catechol resistance regulon transcriptional repressor
MSERSGVTRETDIDFPLWRLIDHTRYMIFRLREKELARFKLTPEKAFVLDIVHASGGATTINRIVAMSQHKHNSISALINRMAQQGLVRKYRTRTDKRAFRILSTEKGEELLKHVPHTSIHKTLEGLSLADKEQLMALLRRSMAGAYEAAGVAMPDSGSDAGDVFPRD